MGVLVVGDFVDSQAIQSKKEGIEVFSTTADVGIRIRGNNYDDLYHLAVSAFNLLVFGEKGQESVRENRLRSFQFKYHGDGCENVLVNLLAEIIYRLNSLEERVERLQINASGETFIDAVVFTRRVKRLPTLEIKSVTYHNLKVKHEHDLKYAEIIFDV